MFTGFSQEAIDFLSEVKSRNSKSWFESHRTIYRKYLYEPFQELVMDLNEPMLSIDPEFETRPLINRTISRIYRDTRFSRDKSLFRNTMWLTYKRRSPDWKNAPSFFFEITPTFYRYGMGYYSASSATMQAFRDKIDDDPAQFQKVIAFLHETSVFELRGAEYKRPKPHNHPPDIAEWYQRKSFYLCSQHDFDDLFHSEKLTDELIAGFLTLGSLYQFLLPLSR